MTSITSFVSGKTIVPRDNLIIDEAEKKDYTTRIASLLLLLAMGNGRSGGDYFGRNANLAGSWCETSSSIEVTKDWLESAADYAEVCPFSYAAKCYLSDK